MCTCGSNSSSKFQIETRNVERGMAKRPFSRYYQGCSRVMTRPASRVRKRSVSRGSGRVKMFQISRVGSGRVKTFSNLSGRVRSGQEVMNDSRVESGHDPREMGPSRVGTT